MLFVAVFMPVMLISQILLAIAGLFIPIIVSLVSVIPSLILALVVARRHTEPVLHVPSLGATVALGVVVAVVTAFNVIYVGEHLLTSRDPGVYLTIARWLSSNGNLLVEGTVGPFEGLDSVTANWNGYFDSRADGLLYAQFLHSYPGLMAGLRWIFGDGALFHANSAIFVAGMSATYVLVSQFVRTWIATLAVSVTAVTVVAFYFARATYSEPLMFLALVVGLLAFHIGMASRSSVSMFSAGLAVGTTALVRIDGWMFVGGFLIACAFGMMIWPNQDRPRFARVFLVLLSPFVASTAGLFDGLTRSPDYVLNRLSLVMPMMGFVAISMTLAVGLAFIDDRMHSVVERSRAWLCGNRQPLRRLTGWLIALAGAVLLFVRPVLFVARGGESPQVGEFLAREGQAADSARTLAELSLRWFTWYWGWVGVALVIAGLLVVLWSRSRIWDGVWYVLLIAGPQFVVYIIAPKIVPDQPWAMRRFYATALVLIPLLMAISFEWIARRTEQSDGHRRTVARYGFVAIAVAAVIYPIVVATSLATLRPQAGLRASTNELCSVLPEYAVVIVHGEPIDSHFGAAIRTFCEVPTVASVRGTEVDRLSELANDVTTRGFVPIVVSKTDLDLAGWETLGRDSIEFPLAEAVFLRPPAGAHMFEFSWIAITP